MFQNFQIEGSLPNVEELAFTNIHKNYLKVIVFNFFLVLAITIGAVYFFINKTKKTFFLDNSLYIFLGIAIIFSVILTLLIIGFFKRKYALREKDISYKSGVLIHTLITVPFSRVQHIEIDEPPFSRFFKLATLNIYTAGESGGDLKIKGIPKQEALKIKEFINNFIHG